MIPAVQIMGMENSPFQMPSSKAERERRTWSKRCTEVFLEPNCLPNYSSTKPSDVGHGSAFCRTRTKTGFWF